MGIGKRAFLYVTRKKARSILLFLIFLAAGLFLLTGISIGQSAKLEAGEFRKTLITGLRLESKISDASGVIEETRNEKGERVRKYTVPFIDESHIEKFLAIEGVRGFYCEDLQSDFAHTGLKLHPGYSAWSLDMINGKIPWEGVVSEEEFGYMENTRDSFELGVDLTRFLPAYESEHHPAFLNGAVELVEGRHIQTKDQAKVIICDEIAEKNGLKVGDQITARSEDYMANKLYGSPYEAEIAGIFHINFEQKIAQDKTFENDILANTFFSTPDISKWFAKEYHLYFGSAPFAPESEDRLCRMTLFLEDPSYWDSVKEELLKIDSVDWDLYEMSVYDRDYQTAAAPLLAIKKFSGLLTVISAAGVLLILSMVLSIWMRSREREAGILSSIGIKKSEVCMQFLLECCGIAVAAFLAAVLLAQPVTRLAGDALQTLFYSSGDDRGYEVTIELNTSDIFVDMLPPAKGEALSYTVTPKEACIVFLLLLGTGILSVQFSSAGILERKPQEVLRK